MNQILNNEKNNSDQISESTLPYGYWCYKSGIKFENYIPSSALNGKYYGKNLDFIFSILVKIKFLFGLPNNLFRKIKKNT